MLKADRVAVQEFLASTGIVLVMQPPALPQFHGSNPCTCNTRCSIQGSNARQIMQLNHLLQLRSHPAV